MFCRLLSLVICLFSTISHLAANAGTAPRPTAMVEILGEPGSAFSFAVFPPTNASALWLRTSNLKSPNQVLLSVDGAPAIALDNAHCSPSGLGAHLGGIGGPLDVLEFTMPSTPISPGGSNQLTFIVAGDGRSPVAPVRILEANFVDANGVLILPRIGATASGNQSGIRAMPSVVAAGSNVWFNAALKSAWRGTNIASHCGDCHAVDGSDLAYFGFSDAAIVQRAKMHGLSEGDASAVLGFIRSLGVPTQGAPWNPPYQPGPGLDSKPAAAWAAGAGIDAVAPDDASIFAAWFGTNTPVIDFTKTLNLRELPVAIPLPSWAEWLPAINPAEYYGTDFQAILGAYRRMCTSIKTPQDLMNWLGVWDGKWADFVNGALQRHFNPTNAIDNLAWYSACRWRNVKTWELVASHHFEGQGAVFYPYPEATAQVLPDNGAFKAAPAWNVASSSFRNGARASWAFSTAQWSWLQLVLNDGQHHRYGTFPVEWVGFLSYTAGLLEYGTPVLAQTVAGLVKSGESATGNPVSASGGFTGWTVIRPEFLMLREFPAAWASVSPTFRNQFCKAWLSEYDRWVRRLGTNYFIRTTHEMTGLETNTTPCAPGAGPWIREHAALVKWVGDNQLDSDSLNLVLNLGGYLWPHADWRAFNPPSSSVFSAFASALPSIVRPSTVIEVAGPPGTTVSVQIVPPPKTAALTLRLSNLKFSGQAFMSVNGAPPFVMDNTNCPGVGLAALLGGIGGPLDTFTVTIPKVPLISGRTNTLSFRIGSTPQNNVDAFRILEINFADTSNTLLAPIQAPVAAPFGGYGAAATTVAAGSNLWFNAPLINSWHGTPMKAHCSDCHAYDGSDLVYFGFSDNSIRQRSMMHGLSAAQSDQILAYLRSLAAPVVSAPWNPPYQPGPGIDSLPAERWAAGAGVDAVLVDERDTFKALFGTNPPSFNFTNTINVRELPINMPLPSWSEWLPAINPVEYYGTDFQGILDVYRKMVTMMNTPQDLMAWLGVWAGQWANFDTGPLANHYSWNNPTDQLAYYSAYRWRNVKIWEILHARHWEGSGSAMYPWPETVSRVFPGNSVFHTAPHFTVRALDSNCLRDGLPQNWPYMSAQWYWLQLVLNDSQHHRYGSSPIDWAYLQAFSTQPLHYGVPATAQILVGLTKAAESSTALPTDPDGGFTGWNQARTEYLMLREFPTAWAAYDLGWRNQLFGAWLAEDARWIYALGRDYFINVTREVGSNESNNTPSAPNAPNWINEQAALLQWLDTHQGDSSSHATALGVAKYLWPAANWNGY
jgi:hypothetical protein